MYTSQSGYSHSDRTIWTDPMFLHLGLGRLCCLYPWRCLQVCRRGAEVRLSHRLHPPFWPWHLPLGSQGTIQNDTQTSARLLFWWCSARKKQRKFEKIHVYFIWWMTLSYIQLKISMQSLKQINQNVSHVHFYNPVCCVLRRSLSLGLNKITCN